MSRIMCTQKIILLQRKASSLLKIISFFFFKREAKCGENKDYCLLVNKDNLYDNLIYHKLRLRKQ